MRKHTDTPLKYWRSRRGISTAKLAELVGTNQQQISKLERGQRRMTEAWMRRLAKPLDVDPSDFIPGPDLDQRLEELELLHAYRRLPSELRMTVLKMAKAVVPEKPTGSPLPLMDADDIKPNPTGRHAPMHEQPAVTAYRANAKRKA